MCLYVAFETQCNDLVSNDEQCVPSNGLLILIKKCKNCRTIQTLPVFNNNLIKKYHRISAQNTEKLHFEYTLTNLPESTFNLS